MASDSDSDIDEILIFTYFTLTEELYDSGGQYRFMTPLGSDGNLVNIIVLAVNRRIMTIPERP